MQKIPKHCVVNITNHALKRYLTRTERMTEETYLKIKSCADSGDARAKQRLKKEREKLENKIRLSILIKIYKDGCEFRRDNRGDKRDRCQYVLKKQGNQFDVITIYVQGRKENFWKPQFEGVKNHA